MTLAIISVLILLFIVQGLYRNRGGKFDALPDGLNTVGDWKGTDNDKWWSRWTLYFTGWQAFGPLSKYWWARWSFPPKVLLAVGGKGKWRYEGWTSSNGFNCYLALSRCQYYKRWALVVEWPFSVHFHIYWHEADVPVEGTVWKNDFDITRLLFLYGPIHWDTTPVYWLLSFYFGGQWK